MSFRRFLFWAHLCVGLTVGLVVFFLATTGMLLAFEPQIQQWAERSSHLSIADSNIACVAPSALLAAARVDQKAAPTSLTLFADPHLPAEVSLGRTVLLLHPCTGEILSRKAGRLRAFFADVKDLHRWVAWGGKRHEGLRSVKNVANLCFFFLVVSGLVLWVPRRFTVQHFRQAVLLRSALRGRARDWNLHNVFGFWMAPPIAAIVLTGVVMAYPWASALLYRAAGDRLPAKNMMERDTSKEPLAAEKYGSLDAAIHMAISKDTRWYSLQMRVPAENDKTIALILDEGRGGQPQKRTQLTATRKGELKRSESFAEASPGRRWRIYARYIHTGELFGLVGQAVAFLASLSAVVLVWTGFALAIRRFRSWSGRRALLARKIVQGEEAFQ